MGSDDLQWPPLDRGWAWSILVAASLMLFCVNGTNRAQSITYQVILTHLNGTPSVSALAAGLQMALKFILGFLGAYGVKRFGARLTVMTGSLLQTTGVLLSLLATEDWHFLITFGLIGGTGAAMAFTGCMITLRAYFEKHRVLAFATANIFKSIGHIIHSLILGWVTASYGYQGFLFAWAAIVIQVCISGALLRPLQDNYKTKNMQIQEKASETTGADQPGEIDQEKSINSGNVSRTTLTESSSLIPEESEETPKTYYFFLMSVFCSTLAYHPPLIFIVDILIERGGSLEVAATITGLAHALDLAVRVLFAFALPRPSVQPYRRMIFYSGMLLSSGSCVGLTLFPSLWTTYLFYTFASTGVSCITTMCLIILGDIISRDYFPTGVWTIGIVQGIGYIIGPILCGFLRNWSDGYKAPLAFSSVSYGVAFLLLLIGSKCSERYKK